MPTALLFPHTFKKIGWFILLPSSLLGMVVLFSAYEPPSLTFELPALFVDALNNQRFFGLVTNNILNEILGVLTIIGLLFVAFSKEKMEDEYISKIRLESLVWGTYINYGILILAFLFVYDLSFFWVMIFNMFTVLVFFIIRYHWQLARLKKAMYHEE